MHAITAAEHFNAVQRHPRYAKANETQGQAIKRFMAARKRAWSSDGRTARDFPQFVPGVTTTRGYVRQWHASHHGGRNILDAASHVNAAPARLAPFYSGPEVEALEEQPELMAA